MKLNIRRLLTLLTLCLSIITTPAWAISKDDAKTQGLIGEQANGYLGLVNNNAGADVQALVKDINSKRRSAYEQGAKKAGVERKVFETRMGQRLQERAPAGHFIRQPNGSWKRK